MSGDGDSATLGLSGVSHAFRDLTRVGWDGPRLRTPARRKDSARNAPGSRGPTRFLLVDADHLALLTAEGCEGDSHHAARPEGDQGQDEVERPVAGLALDEHSLGLNSAHLRHEIGELPRQGLLALLGNRPGLSVGA